MMNDLEYMKNQFDQDEIKAPESLSGDNMLKMIQADQRAEAEKPVRVPAVRWRRYRGVMALAACLILTLIAVPAVRSATRGGEVKTAKTDAAGFEEAVENGDIRTFKNEEEIKRKIHAMNQPGFFDMFTNRKYAAVEEEMAASEDAGTASAAGSDMGLGTAEDGKSYSETYKQVEDVDEADIIKTDGKFIYYVTSDFEVKIYRADHGKAEPVATISQIKDQGRIDNIYLNGDRMVTTGYVYSGSRHKSVATFYDISDHAAPEKIGQFEQSGMLVTSRMVNGIVYLVTNEYASEQRYIPCTTKGDQFTKMSAEDICTFPNPDDTSYIVVSSVDLKSGKKISSKTKAVFGATGDVYCNTENLYISAADYSGKKTVSRLVKIALNDGDLEFVAVGKVPGTVYGQFAMDEKDGYFRIATTAERNGTDLNCLYVLDENLNEVGSVTGFARNEHIEAVRFIGEKAYVITYEQIDPLFILDLSDPEDPQIDGEVKISGFSTLLVPLSDTRLIGIGYGTADNGYGGQMSDGLKIALFDISNPSRPRVLDSKSYKNMFSEAQYDHHALLQNPDEGYLAIPYTTEDDWLEDDVIIEDAEIAESGDGNTDAVEMPEPLISGGVLVFTAEDQIEIMKNYELKDEGVRRCIYIGEYIYAVDDSDEITSFTL